MDGDEWSTVPSKKKGKKKKEESPPEEDPVEAEKPPEPEPVKEKPKEQPKEKAKAKPKPKAESKKEEANPAVSAPIVEDAPKQNGVLEDDSVMTAKKIKKAIKAVQADIEQLELDKQKLIEKWDAEIEVKRQEVKALEVDYERQNELEKASRAGKKKAAS
eukprot:gnl/MRDRNA2_/MRDRNA2_99065_c0_seq1.p1 gnl/MRDRNA2_/MRDRNA2_99065_c0~~gnl/MRDRNA2_/MRDRNA2_99065_c0_seq1.p1  ORF type:complete len:160 (+),score=73.52 gnl/MRDRNA2_/MRDRNA2_99065_c0_seq1:111-590(+)